MQTLAAPLLAIGILTPILTAAAMVRTGDRPPRALAIAAAMVSLACCLMAGRVTGTDHPTAPLAGWFAADALAVLPIVFHALITMAAAAAAPARDASGRFMAGLLIIHAGTTMTCAAANLATLAAGWWITILPFFAGLFGKQSGLRTAHAGLLISCVLLTTGMLALHSSGLSELSRGGGLALACVAGAVAVRKGLFPLHAGTVQLFDRGPLLPAVLLFNGHLGALLVARLEASGIPDAVHTLLHALGTVALVSAVLTGLRAFAERKPRRLLALLAISQASFILAGLSVSNPAGVTGAFVHWLVVSAATTGLACIIRAAEARVAEAVDPAGPLGLAVRAPRLAVFFLVCGLALVGLPGTLGYCAEDLLFHGALESHPFLGVALPLATAFNAISIMRLFGILFLGVLPKHVPLIPDALPRERWTLAACAVFLIAGGILPGIVVRAAGPAARALHMDAAPDPAPHGPPVALR